MKLPGVLAGPFHPQKILGKHPFISKEEYGFYCKRIIDGARILQLKKHSLNLTYKKFVEKNVTLENYMILGIIKHKK